MEKIRGATFRPTATWRTLSQPFHWMPRWLADFGDPFLIRSFNGDVVVGVRSEYIKTIFQGLPANYSPFGANAIRPLTGAASLFATRGAQHTRDRKLLMPPFHGDRMRAYAEVMRASAEDVFCDLCDKPEASFARASERISLAVIIRAVFGVTDPEEERAFGDAIISFAEAFHPTFSFMEFLQRPWFPPWRRFSAAKQRYNDLMDERIERSRVGPDSEDILRMLVTAVDEHGVGMTAEEIKSQLITILFAGYETTALTMSWMIDEIWRNPEVLERLRAEVETLPDEGPALAYTKLPYLQAVIKETLRLHPVVTEVLRKLDQPLQLGPHLLPAGKAVSASILLAHLDEERFPAPHAFKPERFLGRAYGPFDYLPFGGGHRRCIGAAFSTFEMQISMGLLVRNYDVSLHEDAPPRPTRKNLAMAPASTIPITLRRR
jgi:cytochrome P450 family 110